MSSGSYLKSDIFSERYHIFSSIVPTKSLGDAFPMRGLRVFYLFITSLHAVDTLVPGKLLKKCCKVGSIGPLCSKMYLGFARHAKGRKDLEAKHDAA